MTALPQRLRQVLAGLSEGGRLPSWYVMRERAIWSDPPERERTKRRNVLQKWLEALDHPRLSKEWDELAGECVAAGRADPGDLVLRSMQLALRPIEILNVASTKKSVRTIRASAGKLKQALASIHASGANPLALTSGRALVPLTSTVAYVALETVQSLRGRNEVHANTMVKWKRERAQAVADQIMAMGSPTELLMAWLDELQEGCDAMLKDRTQGLRGSEAVRRARALAICLEGEFRDSLGKRKWPLAAALAEAATGQTIDAESLRITKRRN